MLKRVEISIRHIKPIRDIAKEVSHKTLVRDIIEHCNENKAFVFEHEANGFVVLKPKFIEGRPGMLVWVAYGTSKNAIRLHQSGLEELCLGHGAEIMEMWTGKAAVGRLARRVGYEKVAEDPPYTIWRKRLCPPISATQAKTNFLKAMPSNHSSIVP